MAILTFRDKVSEDLCHGHFSRQAYKRLPSELHEKVRIKLARVAAATSLADLQELRGNRLEQLKGSRSGQFSIRINNQYRICFEWHDNNAYNVEVTDYH